MSLGADYTREWLLGVEWRTVETNARGLHQVEHCRIGTTLGSSCLSVLVHTDGVLATSSIAACPLSHDVP